MSKDPNSAVLDLTKPPICDGKPLVDLRLYDQSGYDRGRPGWFVLLWWLVQAIAFPLPHLNK